MVSAELDTLAIAKRLKSAGFSEEQAEAVTGVLHDARDGDLSRLATREDLARLEATTKAEFERLGTEFERFEAATTGRFAAAEAATKAMIDAAVGGLRAEMEILRRDLTIRLGSMIVVATGVLLAAKFFS